MASVYDLKPRFQNLLRPLCRELAHGGVTANQVTVAAVVLSIGEGAAIFVSKGAPWSLLLLPLVLFLRMALNAIDGMLAREFGQKSRLGAILNELGDVVSDSALYLPFAIIPGVNAALMVTVVVLAICSEMTGVVAIQIGAARRYDGPMGKSDRALWLGLLAILQVVVPPPPSFSSVYLAVIAVMGIWTISNRAISALKESAP